MYYLFLKCLEEFISEFLISSFLDFLYVEFVKYELNFLMINKAIQVIKLSNLLAANLNYSFIIFFNSCSICNNTLSFIPNVGDLCPLYFSSVRLEVYQFLSSFQKLTFAFIIFPFSVIYIYTHNTHRHTHSHTHTCTY